MTIQTLILISLLLIICLLLYVIKILSKKNSSEMATTLEDAFTGAWKESGIEKHIGEISTHANEIKSTHKSIEQILRVPKERAAIGELSLESILSDQLPPDMFGMRTKIIGGKIPDAYIKTSSGILCIDSKFTLDNFTKMLETDDDKEKASFKKQFLKDVQGHLNKIASDYVCPKDGSTDFAFAYIPSESVYYFLQTEAFDLLREFSKKGVHITSPLTLSQKIELIKADVHAKRLSENAENVKKDLLILSSKFVEIDDKWKVLYEKHLKYTITKAEEIDLSYKQLREEFDKIAKLSIK